MKTVPIRHVAEVWTSSVDKHTVDGEIPVQLCNYTDAYKKDRVHPGPDLMRATATADEIRKNRLKVGDSVFTKDSEDPNDIGVSAFVDGEADDFVCGYHLAIARPFPSTHGRFLNWVLRSRPVLEHFGNHAAGISRYGIGIAGLRSAPIPLVEEDDQRRIADFLDDRVSRIDRIIAARREQMVLVEAHKGSTVASAFEPWADRQVAVRWMLACRPDYGCLPETTSDDKSWPRYIRTTDISDTGTLRVDGVITADPKLLADYRLDHGDVLVARSGSVGKCMVFEGREPAVFAGYLVRLRFKSIDPRLFWYFTHTANFHGQIHANAVQSTILNFNADRYASMTLPDLRDADDGLLVHLDNAFQVIDKTYADLHRSIELLTEYKSSLITAAVTGELDVSTAGSSIPG